MEAPSRRRPPSYRLLIAASGLLAIVASTCSGPRPVRRPAAEHLAVATWNVNWGGPRSAEAARVIRKLDADIVCLQETTPRWERELGIRVVKAGGSDHYPILAWFVRDGPARPGRR